MNMYVICIRMNPKERDITSIEIERRYFFCQHKCHDRILNFFVFKGYYPVHYKACRMLFKRLKLVLAPGGISHSGPDENRQLWPDENSQS